MTTEKLFQWRQAGRSGEELEQENQFLWVAVIFLFLASCF